VELPARLPAEPTVAKASPAPFQSPWPEALKGAATTELGQWGTIGGHAITALLTVWWTFGIGNLIYAYVAYDRHKKRAQWEREQKRLRALFAEGGPKAVLDDAIRQYAREGWTIQFQSEEMTQLVRTKRDGRRIGEEGLILEVDERGVITVNGSVAKR
jgi:hypothetical protein